MQQIQKPNGVLDPLLFPRRLITPPVLLKITCPELVKGVADVVTSSSTAAQRATRFIADISYFFLGIVRQNSDCESAKEH